MSLGFRRLIVWGVSIALGVLIAWAFIVLGFPIIKAEEAGITIAKYGYGLFTITALPVVLLLVTWLDYFLDTQILPD